MLVQRISIPAHGVISAGSLPASDVATLTQELTSLLAAAAGLLERISAASSAVTEQSAHTSTASAPSTVAPTTPTPAPAPLPVPEFTSGTLLKALLRQRHWQTHRVFCREYDKAAKTVDPALVGYAPCARQLGRWLNGRNGHFGLPGAEHCLVLEAMFPGYTVADLFSTAAPAVTALAVLRAVAS